MGSPPVAPRAMILAAGYGTRLAPLTDHLPKPLLPVGGRPLLDGIIDRLLAADLAPIAVNSHHLGDRIAAHLAAHPQAARLHHFPEADILGTGGALANARAFLAAGPDFLVHNGDVLCDVDLSALVAVHRRDGALATLLLADWPAVNSVILAADGAIRHIGGAGNAPRPRPGDRALTYTGIAVFDRAVLDGIPPGFSSLIAPLALAIAAGDDRVRGWAPDGLVWDDLGTLGRWLAGAGSDADPADGLRLARITGHGSDRRFWRLGCGDWSAVAMVSPPGDDEHERFLACGRFLARHGLGPATVLAEDAPGRAVLMEDLGDETLFALAGGGVPAAAYRQAVDLLGRLQAVTPDARATCPLAVDRTLDREVLRGETAYFSERFLRGHLGLSPAGTAPLEAEFDALADTVAAYPVALLHRDFQSQNILVRDGAIRLVDFQGLRLGPVAYDLASLLFDPYVTVPDDLREELVARFAASQPQLTAAAVAAMTLGCGLQRVMQALGAYGYLGHVKGRRGFLDHVPAAWRRLAGLLSAAAARHQAAAPEPDRLLPPPLPRLTALVAATALPDPPG